MIFLDDEKHAPCVQCHRILFCWEYIISIMLLIILTPRWIYIKKNLYIYIYNQEIRTQKKVEKGSLSQCYYWKCPLQFTINQVLKNFGQRIHTIYGCRPNYFSIKLLAVTIMTIRQIMIQEKKQDKGVCVCV